MDDKEIIELFFKRDERALFEAKRKYEKICYSIAFNIQKNIQDAEETVNDTFLELWKLIPPNTPNSMYAYVLKITKNISIGKLRSKKALKRGGNAIIISIEELNECIPDNNSFNEEINKEMLSNAINTFLKSISSVERQIFVCRYWMYDSVDEISNRFGFKKSKVKMILFRTREKLKHYLEKEGFFYEKC